MKNYYDIHGLLSIEISDGLGRIEDYIYKELKYFKASQKKEADIKVIFKPDLEFISSSVCLLRDLYYRQGVLYFIYPEGAASFPIKDIAKENITLEIDKAIPLHLAFAFIEKILSLKLIEKGYCLIHAACCKVNDCTTLYAALPGTGKTAWVLDNCSQGAGFLSDDLTLLNKDAEVFSYPRAFTIAKYHRKYFSCYLKNRPLSARIKYRLLKVALFFMSMVSIAWKKLKNKIDKYRQGKDYFRIRIEEVVPGLNILKKDKVREILIAFKSGQEFKDSSVWDTERVVDFLVHNTNRELIKFIDLHLPAFYAYGDGYYRIFKQYLKACFQRQKEIMSSAVEKCTVKICYNNQVQKVFSQQKRDLITSTEEK
ncbi:MAG: hypothetical protein JW867_03060 [Candidatus Omnitrophica bacterium]|nr:hypothetical protein [Candidatus Omnitrophota bacterium]